MYSWELGQTELRLLHKPESPTMLTTAGAWSFHCQIEVKIFTKLQDTGSLHKLQV
jgi:hypothetical protein